MGFKMNQPETSNLIEMPLPYLSRERLAAMLDVSTKTIDRRIDEGKLPQPDLHVGRQPRWQSSKIMLWLQTHKNV
jgi:predicted DNA-binding transcriptional regulator AlpA